VNFATVTLCVTSQQVIPKISICFVINSVQKLLDTPSYAHMESLDADTERVNLRLDLCYVILLIFQYRDIVIEVCHILQRHHPLVKPMTFVGQSSSGRQSKGFTQKQQLKVSKTVISFFLSSRSLQVCILNIILHADARNKLLKNQCVTRCMWIHKHLYQNILISHIMGITVLEAMHYMNSFSLNSISLSLKEVDNKPTSGSWKTMPIVAGI